MVDQHHRVSDCPGFVLSGIRVLLPDQFGWGCCHCQGLVGTWVVVAPPAARVALFGAR